MILEDPRGAVLVARAIESIGVVTCMCGCLHVATGSSLMFHELQFSQSVNN
jgi:hypothetical protein